MSHPWEADRGLFTKIFSLGPGPGSPPLARALLAEITKKGKTMRCHRGHEWGEGGTADDYAEQSLGCPDCYPPCAACDRQAIHAEDMLECDECHAQLCSLECQASHRAKHGSENDMDAGAEF